MSTEGSAIAGEALVLDCSITRVDNVSGNVTLQWIGPDGAQLMSNGSITIGIPTMSGATTSLNLQFGNLYTSNSGQYICRGDLTSSYSTYTVLALQDIVIQGRDLVTKGLLISILMYVSFVNFSSCSYNQHQYTSFGSSLHWNKCTIDMHN